MSFAFIKEQHSYLVSDRACFDDLRAAIGPRTRWVILNSLNNPTGAVHTREELRALANILLEHGHVLVMAYDIYEHMRYGGRSIRLCRSNRVFVSAR